MPITAIPAGVEIRKITAVQKRALDELMSKQNTTSTKTTALAVGLPAIFLGLAGLSFLFKDEIKDTIKEEWEDIKSFAEGIPAGIFTGAVDAGFDLGKEITGIDLEATTGKAEEIFGPDVTLCQSYEYDLVELQQRVDNTPSWNIPAIIALGIGKREKLKGMKAAGCEKPPYIDSNDWDRV